MRGHIRKRGDRSWAVVVDIGHDPATGKRRQKWVSVKGTKREAERKLTQVVRDLDDGTYVGPTRLTLPAYLDQWLQDYVATSVRPRTAQGYESIVRRIKKDLGQVLLINLNAQQVQRYYARLLSDGISAYTVQHYHRLLHQAVGQAVKWDLLPRNVLERVTPPRREKPELRCLNPDEVQTLLQAAAGTDFHLPIYMAVYTGLRRSEILGLTWGDVDMDARTITVRQTMVSLQGNPTHVGEPKSRKSRRSVSFGSQTKDMLRVQSVYEGASQVCSRRDGTLMRPYTLSHEFKAIAESCGLKGVRFHDLRHTHASLLLAEGVPVNVVQARMGHESIQTTVDIYGHVFPASDMEAGEILERRLQIVSENDGKP